MVDLWVMTKRRGIAEKWASIAPFEQVAKVLKSALAIAKNKACIKSQLKGKRITTMISTILITYGCK